MQTKRNQTKVLNLQVHGVQLLWHRIIVLGGGGGGRNGWHSLCLVLFTDYNLCGRRFSKANRCAANVVLKLI